MSIPNKSNKYKVKAIIEPTGVIEERRKIGLHPTTPVPAGAIVCYDNALWKWISQLPNRIDCDGWLKGSYLLKNNDSHILVIKAVGYGAPTAVMTFEELVAYGITKFVNLGSAGGLQKNMKIGDLIVCDRAIRDEGTSYHYLPDEKYADASEELTANLCEVIKKKGIPFVKGSSWTIDALYRETIEELQQYREEGVLTVEMEAAALFAVGTYRNVSVSSVFTVSDLLTEDGWRQGYLSEEKLDGLKQIFDAALEMLSVKKGHYIF